MQEKSRFEAAAYALKQNGNQKEHYIIFDLDENSVGYCTVEGKQTALISDHKAGETNLWDDLPQTLREHISPGNQRMEQFLRMGRAQDLTAYTEGETEVRCSQYESFLEPAKHMVTALCEALQDMVSEEILEEQAKIAVIGKLAQLYPIGFYIKDALCGNPFLQDDRFINGYAVVTLVEEGLAQMEQTTLLAHTYGVVILNPKGVSKTFLKVTPEITEEKLASYNFVQGVYVVPGDTLKLVVDETQTSLALPFEMEENGTLIDLVMRLIDGKIMLVVRKSFDTQKIYSLDLPQA